MKITYNIDEQDIIDCLIGAFEGGSNYWYNITNTSMVKEYTGLSFSECVIKSAIDGISIPIYDVEDEDELLGMLSRENIRRGIQLFISDNRALDPSMDAEEADILFQYIVLGEIVYG